MCGIYALVRRGGGPQDEEHLRRVSSIMEHRGHDDRGTKVIFSEGVSVGLAHSRLSVIDLETGSQPMSNEDGSVWIVHNGEVYNFKEIRAGLEQKHQFRTRSDTEVIVHAYEEYGPECVKRLNGMFAFVIWDSRERKLFVARDRLGQKPLYYHNTGEFFAAASTLKALLSTPGIPGKLDWDALSLYFTYQYVPAPLTAFEGVFSLPPAHWAVVDEHGTRRVRYWRPDYSSKTNMSFDESCETLRELLSDAVSLRLVSDVPLGAFLSGGIDSSITVGLMARHHSGPVRTFSIGFPEEKYDERRYARSAAEAFRTDHREFEVGPECLDALPDLVEHYGQPFADSSALPTYYLSKYTRQHVTVALCGDGGDEAFAGYDRYAAMRLGSVFDRLPWPLRKAPYLLLMPFLPAKTEPRTFSGRTRRFLDICRLDGLERYLAIIQHLSDEDKKALAPGAAQKAQTPGNLPLSIDFEMATSNDPVEKIMEVDLLNYLPDDLLVKADVASMAHSLEVRSPFLDHRVVEFAAALPLKWKLGPGIRGNGKYILKTAFQDMLPANILKRGKMGFGIPLASWLRNEWASYAKEILLSSEAKDRGILDINAVGGLLDEHIEGRADNAYKIWNLMCFELWIREATREG